MSFFFIGTVLWVLLGRNLLPTAVGLNLNGVPPFSQINVQKTTTEAVTTAAPTAVTSTPYGPKPFDQAGQEYLTRLHNARRSAVDPPATNMNKVVWSTDLANATASDLESCTYQLGASQPTASGLWLVVMGSYHDINFALGDTLTEWYDFGGFYDYHQKNCTASSPTLCDIYKLLTWSSISTLGCSLHCCESLYDSYTKETKNNKLSWKCLYNNVGLFTDANLNPYKNGTGNDTCTQCESGSGWCDNGLCSSECDLQNANCSCALDPLCNGNGALNETTCACNCTGGWDGNSCDQCGLTCLSANSNMNRDQCRCDCLQGFTLNSTTTSCEDVDECQTSHGCEHICENAQGSYVCTCFDGFSLNNDNQTCASDTRFSSFPSGSTTEASATIGMATTDSDLVCGMEIICNGSGVLDPQTCECYCASGYKGNECNERCPLTGTECWSEYTKPAYITDADYCPVYCFECACDPSEGNCANNGTYSKVPGYELQHGMCRCYCPFPWSGLTCQECNISCYNGGTLDDSTCTCTCPSGFRPPNCLGECKAGISRWCTGQMAPFCDRVPTIRENCPVMCGACDL